MHTSALIKSDGDSSGCYIMLPRSFFVSIEAPIPHLRELLPVYASSLSWNLKSLSWICPGFPKVMPPSSGKSTFNDRTICEYTIPASLLPFGTTEASS